MDRRMSDISPNPRTALEAIREAYQSHGRKAHAFIPPPTLVYWVNEANCRGQMCVLHNGRVITPSEWGELLALLTDYYAYETDESIDRLNRAMWEQLESRSEARRSKP
jgi:hypothetical protein